MVKSVYGIKRVMRECAQEGLKLEHVRFTPTKDLGEYMAKLLGGTDDMRAQESINAMLNYGMGVRDGLRIAQERAEGKQHQQTRNEARDAQG